MPRLLTTIRLSLAASLAFAGAVKQAYVAPIVAEAMRMLPIEEDHWASAAMVVRCIGALEIFAAIALASSASPRRWGLLACLLLAGFTAWDFARWITGGPADCGCFGSLRITSEWWHVLVKQALLWLGFACLLANSRTRSQTPMAHIA